MRNLSYTTKYKASKVMYQSLKVTRHDPADIAEAIEIEHANGSTDPNARQSYQPVILKGRVLT